MSSVALEDLRVGAAPRRRRPGDIAALARSIDEVGLLHPIVVTPDLELIAGSRRLKAVALLGWREVPVTVAENLTTAEIQLRAENDENVCRLDLSPQEALEMRDRLLVLEQPAAADRRAHLVQVAPSSEPPHERKAKARASAPTGYSRRTLDKVADVVRAAEENPERFGPLVDEMNRTGRVDGVHKKVRNIKKAEAISAEPPAFPTGPFRVVVADPPWRYDVRSEDPSHSGALPYPSMATAEICALPVADLAYDDAVLWLWTTNAHMPDAFEVVKAWGFEYKTILTWAKPSIGTGNWLRGQTEHVLLAVRGHPTILLSNQSTLLSAPKGQHSEKPDAFFDLVEHLCPGSKLELFARRPREGWAVFGDEVRASA